jgi:hypothetical protein
MMPMLAQIVRHAQGRPSLRVRGIHLHARPLAMATSLWCGLAAARLGSGPLQPVPVLLCLAASTALVSLCRGRLVRPPSARLGPALARAALLLAGTLLMHAAWTWLTVRHG